MIVYLPYVHKGGSVRKRHFMMSKGQWLNTRLQFLKACLCVTTTKKTGNGLFFMPKFTKW